MHTRIRYTRKSGQYYTNEYFNTKGIVKACINKEYVVFYVNNKKDLEVKRLKTLRATKNMIKNTFWNTYNVQFLDEVRTKK